MHLSVVIPAYNEAGIIAATLEKIIYALNENQRPDFSWEMIVCDNNSSDNTAAIAAEMGAKIVHEPHNQISRARNSGAAVAGGNWLLFIDADSFPPPGLIAEVLMLIEGGRHVGCGSTITMAGGSLWNRLRMERLNPLMRLLKFCSGAFLLCRADAFRAIGGFSTGLYALEEIDFVLRLRYYGAKNNLNFTVLHQNPLVTSGRKGDSWRAWAVLVSSHFMGILLFLLHYLLPEGWLPKWRSRLLGFWYQQRGG